MGDIPIGFVHGIRGVDPSSMVGGHKLCVEIEILTPSASTITSRRSSLAARQGRQSENEWGGIHTFCSLSLKILTKCLRAANKIVQKCHIIGIPLRIHMCYWNTKYSQDEYLDLIDLPQFVLIIINYKYKNGSSLIILAPIPLIYKLIKSAAKALLQGVIHCFDTLIKSLLL